MNHRADSHVASVLCRLNGKIQPELPAYLRPVSQESCRRPDSRRRREAAEKGRGDFL
jgi:hypothetical protein